MFPINLFSFAINLLAINCELLDFIMISSFVGGINGENIFNASKTNFSVFFDAFNNLQMIILNKTGRSTFLVYFGRFLLIFFQHKIFVIPSSVEFCSFIILFLIAFKMVIKFKMSMSARNIHNSSKAFSILMWAWLIKYGNRILFRGLTPVFLKCDIAGLTISIIPANLSFVKLSSTVLEIYTFSPEDIYGSI